MGRGRKGRGSDLLALSRFPSSGSGASWPRFGIKDLPLLLCPHIGEILGSCIHSAVSFLCILSLKQSQFCFGRSVMSFQTS